MKNLKSSSRILQEKLISAADIDKVNKKGGPAREEREEGKEMERTITPRSFGWYQSFRKNPKN